MKRTSLLTRVEPMGVSEEFYARADHNALKTAEDASEKTNFDCDNMRTGSMRQVDRTAKKANVVAAITRLESNGNIVAAALFQFYMTN